MQGSKCDYKDLKILKLIWWAASVIRHTRHKVCCDTDPLADLVRSLAETFWTTFKQIMDGLLKQVRRDVQVIKQREHEYTNSN